jgi:flagellar M-ring protein FliF
MTTAEHSTTLPVIGHSWQNFSRLPARHKLAIMLVLAVVAAVLAATWLWARTPSYAVLFSNLSERDGGAIIGALQQQNIPYKFSEGGGAILVPAHQVHDTRLRLASQGLPKGGLVGFELMETQKLGVSQFLEQVNYQRALEGELARSIQSLAAVAGARVHLAIPKQSAFLRDEQKPSASVLVNLHPGRSLEPAQVAGITHLVSSSVPHLTSANVNVIDQSGSLLSGASDNLRTAGLDPTQLKYVKDLELSYIKRIEDILTPITGPGNLRAQVAADVDFSQAEQTAETYRPNQTPNQPSIRSQQTSESATTQPGAAGVPGALSNQPPAPATAPLTTPPAPGTPAATTSASNAQPMNTRKDATTNFELDKTIRHVKQSVGTIKRLSVAVVVNHKTEKLADGKTKTTPLSDAQMKQINALVKEAMGYNTERGDTLNVANSPFDSGTKEPIPDTPIWKDPETVGFGKDLGKYLVIAGLTAYLLFGVLRPLVRGVVQRLESDHDAFSAQAQLTHDASGAVLPSPAVIAYDQKLANVKAIAKQDPKLVANVIKDWVGNNER